MEYRDVIFEIERRTNPVEQDVRELQERIDQLESILADLFGRLDSNRHC